MTKKGFFRGVFLGAAGAAAVVFAPTALVAAVGAVVVGLVGGTMLASAGSALLQRLSFIKSNKDYPADKGQALTKGEIAFAESILGKKMDADRVKKYFSSTDRENGAEAYGTTRVKFFGAAHGEADYSKAHDLSNAGLFVRQLTHVYQEQNQGILRRAFRSTFRSKKHEYELKAKSRFERFGDAQQASIIEDYARQFIYRENAVQLSPEKLAQLKKVVEKSFPQARRTRLAVETQMMRNDGAVVKAEAVHFPIVVH